MGTNVYGPLQEMFVKCKLVIKIETNIYGTVQEMFVKWKLVFMELFKKRL
jgi:hypothetical protein